MKRSSFRSRSSGSGVRSEDMAELASSRASRTRRPVAAARRITKRVVQAADQRIFPVAPTAKQHWLRIVMDRSLREFIVALEPSSLTAVEISGNAHASDGWKSFHSL